MESIFQAFIAILFCFFLVYVLSYIKQRLLRSLNFDGETQLIIAVRAEGKAKELEQTLKAAEILQRESRMAAEIVIFDGGMATDARETAEIFVRGKPLARIVQGPGDDIWKIPSTPE